MTLRKVIDQKNIVLVKEPLFSPLLGYVYHMYVDNLFLVLVVSFDGGDGWDENDDEDYEDNDDEGEGDGEDGDDEDDSIENLYGNDEEDVQSNR